MQVCLVGAGIQASWHRARCKGSAYAAFILQGVNHLPGLRADNTVDAQVEILLQLLYRRLGLPAEASVDATSVEADGAHPALKTANG